MTIRQPILATLPTSWTDRYLAMLGVEREAPSLAALTRLTRTHLETVLFGSVPSVLRRQATPTGPVPPLDPSAILDTWERRDGSGVCFEIAEMVCLLLTSLGYRAHITLGTIGWPGGHQGVVVELDGRRYLVDVAIGAPLFEPIPLDGVVEVRHVGLGYRFHPGDAEHLWVQDRWIEGEWQPFCTYDLRPATAADREVPYQRHHVPGESWVVGSILLIRSTPDAVYVLRDATLTRFTDAGKTVETIDDPTVYRRLATEVFEAPNLPIDEARAALATIQASSATPA